MNEQDSQREQDIAARARALFTDSVSGLDGATRSRLARARAEAIEAAESGKRTGLVLSSRPVPLAIGALAVLALALIWQTERVPVRLEEASVITDLDMLLDGESLDLIEDLDFYAWLLEQPELLESDAQSDGNG